MKTAEPIDDVSLSLCAALIGEDGNEADVMAIEQLREKQRTQSLGSLIPELEGSYREDAAEFGASHAAQMMLPIFLPAIYSFVKALSKKFFEGAASEAGKMSAQMLKERVVKALSKDTDSTKKIEIQSELARSFERQATKLGLSASSYEGFLQKVKDHPEMLL